MKPPTIRIKSPVGTLYELRADALLLSGVYSGRVDPFPLGLAREGMPLSLEVDDGKETRAWPFDMPAPASDE